MKLPTSDSDQLDRAGERSPRLKASRSAPTWPVGLIFVFGALFFLASLIGEIPISNNATIGLGLVIGVGILLFRVWFVGKTNETRATLAMRNRIKRGLRDKT